MSDVPSLSPKHQRRYDRGPSYVPLMQGVAATIPLALVFAWFTYEAYRRPSQDCGNNNNGQEEEAAQEGNDDCSHLVALGDMIVICLVISFLWAILLGYLLYYIPRRHSLVNAYLSLGKRTVGDLFYTPRRRNSSSSCWSFCCDYHMSTYGSVVYPHPNRDFPIMLRRQVRVYEKFTRERSVLLYLPDQPLSAQPKLDLEIDHEVSEMNAGRIDFIAAFALLWYCFAVGCSTFIRWVLSDMELDADEDGMYFIPRYGQVIDLLIYGTFVFIVVPGFSYLVNYIAWKRHEDWFMNQHKILQEGDPVNPSRCCCWEFDNDDDGGEDADYTSSKLRASHNFRRMMDDR